MGIQYMHIVELGRVRDGFGYSFIALIKDR